LFWEYVRILKEVKPKYFILENVNSMPKEAKALISETLGVEPIMINAALVSAQNRKRLFWTNIPGVTLPEDRGILLKDILEENVDEKYFISNKLIRGFNNKGGNWKGRFSPIKDTEVKCPTLTARYFKMSATDPYIQTKRIGQIGKGGQGDRIYSPDGKSVGLSALGGGRGAKTGLYAVSKPIILGDEPLQVLKEGRTELGKQSRKEIREKTGKDSTSRGKGHKAYFGREGIKANCLTTGLGTEGMVVEDMQIRKLTPIECERLQGLPDNYTEGISNSQRYKCCGNAFNVDVVAHILSFIKNG
jgi:DNA (cytosine-5)-methyltransferase 3A